MSIDQIGIALTGVTAIFLTQSNSKQLQRYACLFGMAGQPFWIWSAIAAEQWGIMLLTAFYTAAWAKGVWTHWIARKDRAPHALSLFRYAFSESQPGSYRLVMGYESLEDLQAAHHYVVTQAQADAEGRAAGSSA